MAVKSGGGVVSGLVASTRGSWKRGCRLRTGEEQKRERMATQTNKSFERNSAARFLGNPTGFLFFRRSNSDRGSSPSPDEIHQADDDTGGGSRDGATGRSSSPGGVQPGVEPRPPQRSALVFGLVKFVNFYNELTVFLWRVAELHMLKLVNLTLIIVVLYQVSSICLSVCLPVYLSVCLSA